LNSFHYIIAGAGCAGLSLAWRILQSPALEDKKILLVDRELKNKNDRTWCFWHEGAGEWDPVVSHRWPRLAFKSESGGKVQNLSTYSYQQISAIDYYRHIHAGLKASHQIEQRIGNVEEVAEDEDGVYILLDGERIEAELVFDSRFLPERSLYSLGGHTFLLQHFYGWVVETSNPVFQPNEATLMDFRVAQQGYTGFFYVLPYSDRKALVEYTLFSPEKLDKKDYRAALQDHMREKLGISDYKICETEFGMIPMTDAPLPQTTSERIVLFGSRGGAIKPTTGYAFLRIQKQTKLLVDQLKKGRVPTLTEKRSLRFRFYDRLLLHILSREGHWGKPIFSRLFLHNDMERILTFLNEESNFLQEARIFATLPVGPFLRAISGVYLSAIWERVRNGLFGRGAKSSYRPLISKR